MSNPRRIIHLLKTLGAILVKVVVVSTFFFVAFCMLKRECCSALVELHMLPLECGHLLSSIGYLQQNGEQRIITSAPERPLINPCQGCFHCFLIKCRSMSVCLHLLLIEILDRVGFD